MLGSLMVMRAASITSCLLSWNTEQLKLAQAQLREKESKVEMLEGTLVRDVQKKARLINIAPILSPGARAGACCEKTKSLHDRRLSLIRHKIA
jgi:hypothetical protein